MFLEDARLGTPAAGAFGLNGIVYHPDGYLLVAKSDNGALYKVPLTNPAAYTQVTTTQNLSAADGLLLQDNNTLQVVSNAQARVFRLATTNGFAAATLSGTFVTSRSSPPPWPVATAPATCSTPTSTSCLAAKRRPSASSASTRWFSSKPAFVSKKRPLPYGRRPLLVSAIVWTRAFDALEDGGVGH